MKVLGGGENGGGAVVHRDEALSAVERDQAGLMCPCVSRATGDDLVLDLSVSVRKVLESYESDVIQGSYRRMEGKANVDIRKPRFL